MKRVVNKSICLPEDAAQMLGTHFKKYVTGQASPKKRKTANTFGKLAT